MVSFVLYWQNRAHCNLNKIVNQLGLNVRKFYKWQKRVGQENMHNAKLPKSNFILPWEKAAIIKFYEENREEGYRRLTFRMIDENIVAVSPTTTWRVLSIAGTQKQMGKEAFQERNWF